MVLVAVAGIPCSRCHRMHEGEHVGIRKWIAGWGVVDVCPFLRHRIAVIGSGAGVLIHHMDEFASAEIAQAALWITPASSNGAAPVGMQVNRVLFHGNYDCASMVAKVGGKTWSARIRSNGGRSNRGRSNRGAGVTR